MLAIALTGGFGTGKTTVLRIFHKLGAQTVNIDSLVHDIIRNPGMVEKIAHLLDERVLCKNQYGVFVSRQRVAGIIFSDDRKRKSLEKLIHPLVLRSLRAIMKSTFSRDPKAVLVCEIPLLFEAGYERYFDTVVAVSCSKKTALHRLQHRGFSRAVAVKRMNAQFPLTWKKKKADFVINNDNGREKTIERVRKVFRKLHSP